MPGTLLGSWDQMDKFSIVMGFFCSGIKTIKRGEMKLISENDECFEVNGML